MSSARPWALWEEFRDISEYKTAFSESRPQSRPENRPWLEGHLEIGPKSIYPCSEPTSSLFHRFDPVALPRMEGLSCQIDKMEDQMGEGEKVSPYFYEFRHSMSLDFDKIDSDVF
jgi:hypothetical protein